MFPHTPDLPPVPVEFPPQTEFYSTAIDIDDFFEILFSDQDIEMGLPRTDLHPDLHHVNFFQGGSLPRPTTKRARDDSGAGPEPPAKRRRVSEDPPVRTRRVKRVKRTKRVISFRDGDLVVVSVRHPRAAPRA